MNLGFDVPAGYHFEIRRCLIPNCHLGRHRLARWEVVKCFYSAEEIPTVDEYLDTYLYARTYPHVWGVVMKDKYCRVTLEENLAA